MISGKAAACRPSTKKWPKYRDPSTYRANAVSAIRSDHRRRSERYIVPSPEHQNKKLVREFLQRQERALFLEMSATFAEASALIRELENRPNFRRYRKPFAPEHFGNRQKAGVKPKKERDLPVPISRQSSSALRRPIGSPMSIFSNA